MKKNLLLAAVLGILLVITYFVQEKRVESEYAAERIEGKVISGEVTSLKLPHVEAKKKDGQWWSGDQLLSHNKFKQIEEKLNDLKMVKTLKGKWEQVAENPLDFEVNSTPWSLGDFSLDKSSFYLKAGDKMGLAFIDAEGNSMGTSAEEIEMAKLAELKNLLSTPLEAMKEKQLFRFYPKLDPVKIEVKPEGNIAYKVNFKDNTTDPAPIEGVSTYSSLAKNFFSLLTQVLIREKLPYSEALKVKKLSEIKMIGHKGEEILWELWLRNKDSADAVILDAKNKKAFLMVGGTLKAFFLSVQDYWDKKVIPPSVFQNFERLPVTLTQGEKSAVITVINREPLDFKASNGKVKRGHMSDLFYFIFNLGTRDQADRVSQLSSSERKQLLSGEHLRAEVMGQDLLFWRKPQELIVVNLTQGFKAHFLSVSETFRAKFEDVLE